MLLQTNSYIVRSEQRADHARLMRQFRACFRRLGAEFEVYEQDERRPSGQPSKQQGGRFVQVMRFRDRAHHRQHANVESQDQIAQDLVAAFCKLVDLPYQQEQGLFTSSVLTTCLPCSEEDAGPGNANDASATPPTTDNQKGSPTGAPGGGSTSPDESATDPQPKPPAAHDDSDADDLHLAQLSADDAFDDDAIQYVDQPEVTPKPDTAGSTTGGNGGRETVQSASR